MATATAKFDAAGTMVAFLRTDREFAPYTADIPATFTLAFDPETNPAIADGMAADWNAWRYDGVTLRRRGVAVTVNPPGERKALEDARDTLTAALRASGWDGLAPAQRTNIILLLLAPRPAAATQTQAMPREGR